MALRSGQKERLEGLRYLLAQIQNLRIELQKEPGDEEVVKLLKREAKRRREAIEAYQKGGRDDLVKKETGQLRVIEEFLPEKMSEEELNQLIGEVISTSELKEFGPLMKKIMEKSKGKADGKRVAVAVKKRLAGLKD